MTGDMDVRKLADWIALYPDLKDIGTALVRPCPSCGRDTFRIVRLGGDRIEASCRHCSADKIHDAVLGDIERRREESGSEEARPEMGASDPLREMVGHIPKRGLRQFVARLVERFGHERVNVEVMLAAMGDGKPDPFARGLMSAAKLPAPEEPPRLWMGLYRGSVTLLIGETGAGKSSLLYNLAIHAARNEPLYGIDFGLNRPLNVLYIDPENAGNWDEGQGGICAVRLERIGQGRPDRLIFHDGRGVNLSDPVHVAALGQFLERERIDLCIVDPIANLFSTEDENDNAEGTRQIKALVLLARKTGACIIPCHHTGKDTTGIYGRGASSRLGAADAGMVFRVRNGGEDRDDEYQGEPRERDDFCRLQIVKNRWEGTGSLFLKMAGNDQFDRVSFDEWKSARSSTGPQTKGERCAEEILLLLMDSQERSRTEIHNALASEGFGQKCIDDALAALARAGNIQRRQGERNLSFFRRPVEANGSLLSL